MMDYNDLQARIKLFGSGEPSSLYTSVVDKVVVPLLEIAYPQEEGSKPKKKAAPVTSETAHAKQDAQIEKMLADIRAEMQMNIDGVSTDEAENRSSGGGGSDIIGSIMSMFGN
jgi:hypothetical protein